MSYDVSIGDYSYNMTSNVSRLWYDHIPAKDSCGGLHELHGKTGKQASIILHDAFTKINQTRHDYWSDSVVGEPHFCALYDAPNGWGSTVGAIVFLGEILGACARNPRKKVSVSS